MKLNSNYEVIFVYSEIQYNEEDSIATKVGKRFKPGKLYFGKSSKDYTKMIKKDQYTAMRAQYPDVRVVAEGPKDEFKYTEPKKEFI